MKTTIDEQIAIILNHIDREVNSKHPHGSQLAKFGKQVKCLQRLKVIIPKLQAERNPKFKSGFLHVEYVQSTVFHTIARLLYEMNDYEYHYAKDYNDDNASFYFYGDNMGIQVTNEPEDYISLGVYAMPKELQNYENPTL